MLTLVADLLGILDALALESVALLGIPFGEELAAEFTVAHASAEHCWPGLPPRASKTASARST